MAEQPSHDLHQVGQAVWFDQHLHPVPGHVLQGRCRAAFVFAPDQPLSAGLLLNLGALALFDAVAVLAPPQVPVRLAPPDGLAVDGGRMQSI